jgi:hypothetical protein
VLLVIDVRQAVELALGERRLWGEVTQPPRLRAHALEQVSQSGLVTGVDLTEAHASSVRLRGVERVRRADDLQQAKAPFDGKPASASDAHAETSRSASTIWAVR